MMGKKTVIGLKADPQPGMCRVIADGESCERPARRRGLCLRHYATIWQRDDLDLDDFALPLVTQARFELRARLVEGECRVRENGVDCRERPHLRGLCRSHYGRVHARGPELLRRLATPAPRERRHELRKRLVEGRCRVAEDGQGCGQVAARRGLCMYHHGRLKSRPEQFEALALPSALIKRRYERSLHAGDDPGRCVVLEDGASCSAEPWRRGVCRRHHRILGTHKEYSLEQFYLAAPDRRLSRKPEHERGDGWCVLLEDSIPCDQPPFARGLCRPHYRRVSGERRLEALGLPARTPRGSVSDGNDRPHFYLDRQVLFDHADHLWFGAAGQAGSVVPLDRPLFLRALQADGLELNDAIEWAAYQQQRELPGAPGLLAARGATGFPEQLHPLYVGRALGLVAAGGRSRESYPEAGMPLRILRVKARPEPDACAIEENGAACARRRKWRGLCVKHAQLAHMRGEFDLLAQDYLPPGNQRHRFEVKRFPEAGLRRIVTNGQPCRKLAASRGLCSRHYGAIWRRPDGCGSFTAPLNHWRSNGLRVPV